MKPGRASAARSRDSRCGLLGRTLDRELGAREGRQAVAREELVVLGRVPVEARVILTPQPGPAPRINGPSLTGVTPGHDVLYKIPVTGAKPITHSRQPMSMWSVSDTIATASRLPAIAVGNMLLVTQVTASAVYMR